MTALAFRPPPPGRLRVSAAVLDHVVTVAASGVQGVLSTESLVRGAAVGGAVGGALGLVQAGPVGAAVGVSVGTAAGAAVAHVAGHAGRHALREVEAAAAPPLRVSVVARYGEDLGALAARVRAEVEAALVEALGLVPTSVTVEVVDVADPAARPLPDAGPSAPLAERPRQRGGARPDRPPLAPPVQEGN